MDQATGSMHLPTPDPPFSATTHFSINGIPGTQQSAGHTLVEICIALTIAAALIAMSATAVDALIGARVVEGAAAGFAQDIQYARAQSVALNRNVTIAFRNSTPVSTGCYSLYTGITGSCDCLSSGESICTEGSTLLKTVVIPAAHGVSMAANVPRMHVESGRGLIAPAGYLTVSTRDQFALKQTVNIVGRVRTCSSGGPLSDYPRC